MRLFIAIGCSEETKRELITLRDELRSRSERGRFSPLENLHLTLVFLGECDAMQTSAAKSAMDAASADRFTIRFDRIGCFKRPGGDIWWVGVQKSNELMRLHNELAGRLNEAGFALEKRSYTPHITLGREIVADITPWRAPDFYEEVTRIALMKSEKIYGKQKYTMIYECRLS